MGYAEAHPHPQIFHNEQHTEWDVCPRSTADTGQQEKITSGFICNTFIQQTFTSQPPYASPWPGK